MQQLSLFGEELALYSIDPTQNRYRYYFLSIQHLKPDYHLIEKRWGRLRKSKAGNWRLNRRRIKNAKTESFQDPQKATKHFQSMLKSKATKGYLIG